MKSNLILNEFNMCGKKIWILNPWTLLSLNIFIFPKKKEFSKSVVLPKCKYNLVPDLRNVNKPKH